MPGTRITLEIDGKPEFDRVFKRVDLAFSDLTPVWETVRDEFWQIEKDQFQSEGSAGKSGKWKPLSPAYEKAKVNKYGTFAYLAGVLQATQAMYKAFTRQTSDSIVDIKKDSIAIGAGGEVGKRALYHQRGGGRLPQRKIIDFSEKQKTGLMKKIQKKMLDVMKKSKIPVS